MIEYKLNVENSITGCLLEAKRKGPLCQTAVMRQSIFKERAFGKDSLRFAFQ